MSKTKKDTTTDIMPGTSSNSGNNHDTPSFLNDDSSTTMSAYSETLNEHYEELIKITNQFKGELIDTSLIDETLKQFKAFSIEEITLKAFKYHIMMTKLGTSYKNNHLQDIKEEYLEEMETTNESENQKAAYHREISASLYEESNPTMLSLTLENIFDNDTILIIPHNDDEAPAIIQCCRKGDGCISAHQNEIPKNQYEIINQNLQKLAKVIEEGEK